MSNPRTEIWRMTFRIERMFVYFIYAGVCRFPLDNWRFWVIGFMLAYVLDKFEDSVRREYGDTTREKLERLMKEEMGDYDE